MPDTDPEPPQTGRSAQRLVLVTGPSGAGRSTAINALEDLGWEAIDNLPLSFLPRLMAGPPLSRPLALGIDVRNRDFSLDTLAQAIDRLERLPDVEEQVLYLDCSDDELVRRYSETRRRHPLAEADHPLTGILRERELLVPIRARADALIDTTGMSPHDLREEITDRFGDHGGPVLGLSVQSFSYKRGLPRGADLVFDVRFLRNPHWEAALRGLDGRDGAVQDYVRADPRFADFFDRVRDMVLSLLPAYRDEGKSHLSIAFGCTGGQHRSVTLAEELAAALAEQGWPVSKRHRELERRGTGQDRAAPNHRREPHG